MVFWFVMRDCGFVFFFVFVGLGELNERRVEKVFVDRYSLNVSYIVRVLYCVY